MAMRTNDHLLCYCCLSHIHFLVGHKQVVQYDLYATTSQSSVKSTHKTESQTSPCYYRRERSTNKIHGNQKRVCDSIVLGPPIAVFEVPGFPQAFRSSPHPQWLDWLGRPESVPSVTSLLHLLYFLPNCFFLPFPVSFFPSSLARPPLSPLLTCSCSPASMFYLVP